MADFENNKAYTNEHLFDPDEKAAVVKAWKGFLRRVYPNLELVENDKTRVLVIFEDLFLYLPKYDEFLDKEVSEWMFWYKAMGVHHYREFMKANDPKEEEQKNALREYYLELGIKK